MATAPARRPPAARVRHLCTACGAESPKWQGRCPACGEWNTLEQAAVETPRVVAGRVRPAVSTNLAAEPQTLDSVSGAEAQRRATGLGECDRVLGGGIV